MALKLKYTDEHGIVHINMSPNSSPQSELKDPQFDTINNRFGNYDLFGGKYDPTTDYKTDSSGEGGSKQHSLFRSRYNSIEEELANTPYAFATERSLRSANQLDITIDRSDISPSKDIEDDRFFHRRLSLDYEDVFRENTPAFTVTQLIHAQDRYFDLSAREKAEKSIGKDVKAPKVVEKPSFVLKDSPPFERVGFVEKPAVERANFVDKLTLPPGKSVIVEASAGKFDRTFEEQSGLIDSRSTESSSSVDRTTVAVASGEVDESESFKILKLNSDVKTQTDPIATTVVPISVRKKEKSFAILTETPTASRPSSPRSLPVDIRQARVSPFKGRGFREETSRHNTPRTSASNSRANSPPPRRRTNSLSKIEDDMASTATLPPPIILPQTHSPRNFLRENIEEIREISELNREKHEAEAEQKKIEEETAILKEMGLSEKDAKKEATRSVVASRNNSRTNSRSNSPSKVNLRSRSNSPSAKLNKDGSKSTVFINASDGLPKPVTHRSRVRSVSKSQPQSKGGSPKSSQIPKRQNSVSPKGVPTTRKTNFISRRPGNSSLSQNQKYMSSSTSSIHETIRVGSTIHDKRALSQSAQHLSISPAHIKGKPPISPGRGGPPPSNRTINAKRLSPIVGTPNKSPTDDSKIGTKTGAKSTLAKRPIKTTGNTPATSRVTSRQPSREPSPDKRKTAGKSSTTRPINNSTKPINRTPSSKSIQKPATPAKTDPKRTISRTDSMKSLNRTPSTKNLAGKPPLKRSDSKVSNKSQSSGKINEIGRKDSTKEKEKKILKSTSDSATDPEEIPTQDSETQYDKITNEKGELVLLTKKSIISMTTAAITAQPLELVTTVTNQLPATFEKAREKRKIERLSSKESLTGKDEVKIVDEKKKPDRNIGKTKKESKNKEDKENDDKIVSDDNPKLKPLQYPFNDPALEKVKQKIDDILKTPEISRENILTSSAKSEKRELPRQESKFKNLAVKTKDDVKQSKDSISDKLIQLKNQMQQEASTSEKVTSEIRAETIKIVDSIITPVEEPPRDVPQNVEEVKIEIEPIVMVVNEKKKEVTEKKTEMIEKKEEVKDKKEELIQKKEEVTEKKKEIIEKKKEVIEKKKEVIEEKKDLMETIEKVNETLVKGEAEVEVQSSNVSTPGMDKIRMEKKADGNGSDKSQSNGGFPQSTSTTPKPPARTRKEQKEKEKEPSPPLEAEVKNDPEDEHKKPNICSRLMGKCKSKCCPCCIKGEEEEKETEELTERAERERTVESMAEDGKGKQGMMSKFSCCKKKKPEVEEVERDMERAAGKGATIEFEDETKRKRKLRDIICCCGRRRRVTDAAIAPQNVADVTMAPGVVGDTGCCGKKRQVERRDSILSDRSPTTCCNKMGTWFRGMCRRREPQAASSRRASMFSKNKSLSPTLPPEDTRKKLDPALVEHSSVIRAAIPILPIALAYCCLLCNVVVPGLGSIFSGLFCLCFGIPRFGPHDGAKYRIGCFIINLLVGAGQLFTVLFCLVGWGWSIWWGVIMVKLSRKYRRLNKEAAIAEAEAAQAAPPVTTNNHTRA